MPAAGSLDLPVTERGPIPERLPCGRVRQCFSVRLSVPEELVGRRHDVLDLGTGTRFQERYRVDQHVRIGQQSTRLFELGHRCPCFDARLEHHSAFQIGVRR